MNPIELQLVETAKSYTLQAVQFVKAFDAAQAHLQLENVLSPQHLSSSSGTAKSLEILDRLAQLMSTHKSMFESFILKYSAQAKRHFEQLPQDLRAKWQSSTVDSINRQLMAQSKFYAGRERWIATAREICMLIESTRATSRFQDGTVIFADNQNADKFEELLSVIDRVHQDETALLAELTQRIAGAAAALGIR